MEELNAAVKGLQSKVTSLEIEVNSVKMKQKALDDNFTSMEQNSAFVDEQVQDLIAKTYKNNDDVSDTRRKLLYLEASSRRENLKFEGIPKLSHRAKKTPHWGLKGLRRRKKMEGEGSTENTKKE